MRNYNNQTSLECYYDNNTQLDFISAQTDSKINIAYNNIDMVKQDVNDLNYLVKNIQNNINNKFKYQEDLINKLLYEITYLKLPWYKKLQFKFLNKEKRNNIINNLIKNNKNNGNI